jgi:hypothetical protein
MVNENSDITAQEQYDIIKLDMDKREFKITVGIRSYWITKDELDRYMRERTKPGVDHVALRGGLLLLPVQCQDIVHRSVIEDSEKIDDGRWQCDAGNWHNAGSNCYCDKEMVELEDGTMRIQEKTGKALPEPQREKKPARSASYQLAGSIKSF